MMIKSVASFLTAAFLAIAAFAAPQSAQAAPATSALSIPVNTATAQGTFNGVMRITSFGVQNNVLVASGTVSGTVVGATGVASSVVRSFTTPVNIPASSRAPAAAAAAVGCEILHLELGPLDLDLLGLVVHLDKVVLDLTAVPGAGNLLGNLLCAVTNLLNTGGALTQIASLLNQIIGLLG